jgi:hypothetical protein
MKETGREDVTAPPAMHHTTRRKTRPTDIEYRKNKIKIKK